MRLLKGTATEHLQNEGESLISNDEYAFLTNCLHCGQYIWFIGKRGDKATTIPCPYCEKLHKFSLSKRGIFNQRIVEEKEKSKCSN